MNIMINHGGSSEDLIDYVKHCASHVIKEGVRPAYGITDHRVTPVIDYKLGTIQRRSAWPLDKVGDHHQECIRLFFCCCGFSPTFGRCRDDALLVVLRCSYGYRSFVWIFVMIICYHVCGVDVTTISGTIIIIPDG